MPLMPDNHSIHESSIITNCQIGNNVIIGPFCCITDTTIGDNVVIEWGARIDKTTLANRVEILWGGIIRESILWEWCVIGGEVKKSELGKQNKAKHPGTSIVSTKTGEKVNFWGGFKCANYDGTGKGHFVLGDRVFLGCNSVISVKANQTTTIENDVKIWANVHIGVDVSAYSLVYIDRDSGKVSIREGYYKK
jgi:bifunctional N-acetylglucosamine-1-phosphate-uridyltransferase/glucosamine-1-phosphate-acetyltransferase GlmU-like protein